MMKNRRGISLIELVLTLALIGLVLQVGFSILSVGSTSHGVSTNKGFSQQDIRIVGDFIANELRTVTDISDVDDYVGTYYSLSVIEDVNTGQKSIVKHKLVYTGNGDEEDKSSVTTKTPEVVFTGNWESIRFTNGVMGEILLELSQTEGTGNRQAHFELPITITTLNKSTLFDEALDVELVSGDVLYYLNNSLDMLTRGIEIGEIPTTPTDVKVDFYSEGTLYFSDTGLPGTELTSPTEPTREGYIFEGWHPEVPSVFPSSDTDYIAQWTALSEASSTISMYVDGTFYKSIEGNIGESVPSITNPTRDDGYSFAGWDPTIPGVFPAEDLRVDATWVDSVSNLRILKITSNGNTVTESGNKYTVDGGSKIEIHLAFDYSLSNSRLGFTTTAFTGSFAGSDSGLTISGDVDNKNYNIIINIVVSEIDNPNNSESVSFKIEVKK